MTHAHFLQIGGFRVNFLFKENFYCGHGSAYRYSTPKKGLVVREAFVSFYDLQKLLNRQLIDFPETTAKEIEDRSKSDALSKGVALLQISWFLIQLIARVHQHLAITEIELTTAALAGLNSIMYLFWWNKPFDVRCPIVIRTKELDWRLAEAGRNLNERAVGTNDKQTGGSADRKNEGDNSGSRTSKDERETGKQGASSFTGPEDRRNTAGEQSAEDNRKEEQPSESRNVTRKAESAAETIEKPEWSFPVYPPDFDLRVHLMTAAKECMGRVLNTIRAKLDCLRRAIRWPQNLAIWLYKTIRTGPSNSAGKSAVRRFVGWIWTCCESAVTKLLYLPYLLLFVPTEQILRPSGYPNLSTFSHAKDKIANSPSLQLLFNVRDMRWIMSMMFYSEEAETTPLLIFSALAGAAFGSIHCSAWNSQFPSAVEQVLWRTASLAIVGVCLSIIPGITLYIHVLYQWHDSRRVSWDRQSMCHKLWAILKKTMETAPAIAYPLARVSLLILSLLSLRDLSPSALDSVTWTKFIPHI